MPHYLSPIGLLLWFLSHKCNGEPNCATLNSTETITLNSSLSASYQPCNRALIGTKEPCWTTRITWLYPPVETLVDCGGSVTYFLNQQSNSCEESVPVEITTLTTATPSQTTTITAPPLSSNTFNQCVQSLAEMFTPPGPQRVLRPPIKLSDLAHISAYCTKFRTHSCELVAARAHLYYVPNSELYQTRFRNLCRPIPFTSIRFPTRTAQGVTSLVVIKGTTLPANKVYVSVDNLAAWKFSTGLKGTLEPWFVTISPGSFTGMLFTMESEALSSIRHPFTYGNTWPFNYADMIDPVPLSAWAGIGTMIQREEAMYFPQANVFDRADLQHPNFREPTAQSNATMPAAHYSPIIAASTIASQLGPEWEGCVMNGFIDPPIQLSAITVTALREPELSPQAPITWMHARATPIPGWNGLSSGQVRGPGKFKPVAQPGATITPRPQPTDLLHPTSLRHGKGSESGSDADWRVNAGNFGEGLHNDDEGGQTGKPQTAPNDANFDLATGDELNNNEEPASTARIESYDSDNPTATTKISQKERQSKLRSSGSLIGRIPHNFLFGCSSFITLALII